MLSKKNIATFIFIITILLLKVIKSFEIRMVFISTMLFISFFLSQRKVSKKVLDLLVLLLIILVLGVIRAFFFEPKIYDFIKDVLYFAKPVLLILLGYFISKSINNWKLVLKMFIYLSVFMAFFHLIHTVLYTDFNNANVSYIRSINGLGNIIEVFALAVLLASFKHQEIVCFSKKETIFYIIILFSSFVFYFSRTMFVALFLVVLASYGYAKLNRKGIKYISVGILAILLFYTYLFSANIPRDSVGFQSFLYKMKIAPEEIFSPKLDLKNKAALWDHWRAYEAYSAVQGLEGKTNNLLFGKGFGALVDLKFVSPLGEHGMRYIPVLHNGYMFIIYKVGVLGLLFYLLFLFYLYAQSYSKKNTAENKIIRDIIAGIGLYLLFSSLIITGLYNVEEITPLVLGVFLYLKMATNKEIIN